MAPTTAGFPVRDWLNSGWILEVPDKANGEHFWVGGFQERNSAVGSISQAEIWTPNFFEASVNSKRELSGWAMELRWDELERALAIEFSLHPKAKMSTSLVSWTGVDSAKRAFSDAFTLIQEKFKTTEPNAAAKLEKAVPWIFRQGYTASGDLRDWLLQRILFGLRASLGTDLRLYGRWDQAEGFLGLTPEDLATFDGHRFKTMAVAGTRSIKGKTAEETETIRRELLADEKELNEHRHVVQDLEATLRGVGDRQVGSPVDSPTGAHLQIENLSVGKTEAHSFRHLLHLVTPITATIQSGTSARDVDSEEKWKLLQALHPTPALGTSPRDSGLSLLRQIEKLNAVPRKGFGAPFAVKLGSRLECVVAIRQFRWVTAGPDRLHIAVGSGCGVVPASQLEKEWDELASKRESVLQAFGLSAETRRPIGWSIEVINDLIQLGVRRFVVCAGARNAPLVVAIEAIAKKLSHNPSADIQVDSFFEERSAAFYALGVAKNHSLVAILTTSGTAVTELHSAFAEADLTGVPLIAVTADRPRRLRNTGAPQSIDQNQIFSHFAGASFDLEEGEKIPTLELHQSIERRRPLHINLCFEEPLLNDRDSLHALLDRSMPAAPDDAPENLPKNLPESNSAKKLKEAVSTAEAEAFREALKRRSKHGGVAIVSTLEADERELVAEFILRRQIPCLLEATSGLRGDPRFSLLELKGGDRDLQQWVKSSPAPQVFRFGGIPTTRVWRDLDDPMTEATTFSISRLRFSGLGRGQVFTLGLGKKQSQWPGRLQALIDVDLPTTYSDRPEVEAKWMARDHETARKLEEVLVSLPQAEPRFVREISKMIPSSAITYVGNSLPIRWWDWVALRKSGTAAIFANRGVNGIDGQISTAIGLAAGQKANELWVVVGDLTALYDLSGLWASKFVAGIKIRIVVINNSGGLIFRQVLKSSPGGSGPFENAHSLNFKNWAAMWGFSYEHCTDSHRLAGLSLPERIVIELSPDAKETEEFWRNIE